MAYSGRLFLLWPFLITGGYYTVKTDNDIRIVALNTNLYYIMNKQVAKESDPSAQFDWLTRTLSDAQLSHEKVNDPGHVKIYNKTCATSEDSDQPAHPRSLIRVFADRMCLLQPPGYPKRDKREPLSYWVDVQAELSLFWSHRSYCRFCRALGQIIVPDKGRMQINIFLNSPNVFSWRN